MTNNFFFNFYESERESHIRMREKKKKEVILK